MVQSSHAIQALHADVESLIESADLIEIQATAGEPGPERTPVTFDADEDQVIDLLRAWGYRE